MARTRLADATLRTCRFAPYRKGMGPTFVLTMWDTYHTDRRGCTIIGYRLNMLTSDNPRERVTLFEGEDFAGSPMHADDSDECVRSLMVFLTLRPGDTDADYFASETEIQREYRERHAEMLSAAVEGRYGDGY